LPFLAGPKVVGSREPGEIQWANYTLKSRKKNKFSRAIASNFNGRFFEKKTAYLPSSDGLKPLLQLMEVLTGWI